MSADAVKRIRVLAQDSQPIGNTDREIARGLAMGLLIAGQMRQAGDETLGFALLVQNELAFARFQGYREAIAETRSDEHSCHAAAANRALTMAETNAEYDRFLLFLTRYRNRYAELIQKGAENVGR